MTKMMSMMRRMTKKDDDVQMMTMTKKDDDLQMMTMTKKDDDVQMRARDASQLPPLQRLSNRRATTERCPSHPHHHINHHLHRRPHIHHHSFIIIHSQTSEAKKEDTILGFIHHGRRRVCGTYQQGILQTSPGFNDDI